MRCSLFLCSLECYTIVPVLCAWNQRRREIDNLEANECFRKCKLDLCQLSSMWFYQIRQAYAEKKSDVMYFCKPNPSLYGRALLEHKDDIRFLTAILFVTIISTIIIPVATPFMTHTKSIAAFKLVFFVRAVYLKKIFRKIMRLHMQNHNDNSFSNMLITYRLLLSGYQFLCFCSNVCQSYMKQEKIYYMPLSYISIFTIICCNII